MTTHTRQFPDTDAREAIIAIGLMQDELDVLLDDLRNGEDSTSYEVGHNTITIDRIGAGFAGVTIYHEDGSETTPGILEI